MISILEIIQHLIYGMLLGAVVGIDREKLSVASASHKFGGFRTYTLIGMFGVLLALIQQLSEVFFAILLAGFLLLMVASYVTQSIQHKNNGGTSEMASLIVLISGYFIGIDNYTVATVITIATVALLYGKDKLRNFAVMITPEEMKSIIQFIIIAFIVLPLLPNQYFGPFNALNPSIIWTMIVVISGISFLSYLATKIIGPKKGISLSGFLGGLISSTAVTLAFSKNSKKYKGVSYPFVFGIVIAGSAMFFRILIEISIVNPALLNQVTIPLVAAGGTGLIISAVLWQLQKKEKQVETEIDLGKPLDLYGAIKFGLVFAVVLVFAKYMSLNFGDKGIYISSIVSGLVDTDAIAISLANLSKNGVISNQVAATGITLATLSNTLVKGAIVLALASRAVAIRTFISVLIIVASGLLALYLF